MLDLLQCPGYPVIEDEVASRALDFWNAFTEEAECFTDDPEDPQFNTVKEYIAQAADRVWVKIKVPPDEEWESLEIDLKKEFNEFRTQAKDLLASSYLILGSKVVQMFGQRFPALTSQESWYELES